MGKKITFELAVNKKASNVDLFQQVDLGEKDGLTTMGAIRMLLVLWVEQIPGTRSYTYYFNLEMVGSGDTESKFLQVKRPSTALDWQELMVAFSTIQVRGTLQNIDGHQMFSLSLSFVVREIARAEAEAKKKAIEKRAEAQQKAETEIIEAQKRTEQERRDAQTLAKNKKSLRRWITASLGVFIPTVIFFSVCLWLHVRRKELSWSLAGVWLGAWVGVFSGFVLIACLADWFNLTRRDWRRQAGVK